jgi:hypothetical protein
LPFTPFKPEYQRMKNPESVNFDSPPSKFLGSLYRKHNRGEYKKTVDGRQLFKRLKAEEVAEKCPRLKEMLDEMLNLAVQARIPLKQTN